MVVAVQHELGAMLREHVQERRRVSEPLVPWAPAERRMMDQHHAEAAGDLGAMTGMPPDPPVHVAEQALAGELPNARTAKRRQMQIREMREGEHDPRVL